MLVFEDKRDYDLVAEYIIVQGGKVEIGTKDEPFLHRVTVTLARS